MGAGAAACALLVAGLGYALTDRSEGNEAGADQAPAGASASLREAGTTPAASAVRVSVVGSNTTYAGACPSPGHQAPTFTATFTAAEPTRISYRWVSKDGSVVDPHWRVLSIGDEGTRTSQDTVRLTTYAKAGTLNSEIGVELRQPFAGTSNAVPFSMTCGG